MIEQACIPSWNIPHSKNLCREVWNEFLNLSIIYSNDEKHKLKRGVFILVYKTQKNRIDSIDYMANEK